MHKGKGEKCERVSERMVKVDLSVEVEEDCYIGDDVVGSSVLQSPPDRVRLSLVDLLVCWSGQS